MVELAKDEVIDREMVALELLERIHDIFDMQMKEARVSKWPKIETSSYVVKMVGFLKSKMDGRVGQVRVTISVPRDEDKKNVDVRIDFTKNLHLFWWTREFVIKKAADDPMGADLGKVHSVAFDVNMARRNLIRSAWLSRKYQNTKKKAGEGYRLPSRV